MHCNDYYYLEQGCDVICALFSSAARTPTNSVVVERRSKSKSYRQSYRSCVGAASRLCFTPGFTARRLNASRRAPKSHNVTVSQPRPLNTVVFKSAFLQKSHTTNPNIIIPLPVKGQSESTAAGLTNEDRVAAVLRHSPLPVQTHPVEELLQAALGLHCRGEAARFGRGGGGSAEQLQSVHLCGARDGRGGRRRRDSPHTGKQRTPQRQGEAFQGTGVYLDLWYTVGFVSVQNIGKCKCLFQGIAHTLSNKQSVFHCQNV